MRLINQLAANRLYYRQPLPTLPDILLIDIPLHFSGSGLALDRYYPVIFESLAEMHEFEIFLCEPRAALVPPALLDRRPSALRTDHIVVARYRPPDPHWHWLQLCCWPARYKTLVPDAGGAFARGAYTVDAFISVDDIDAAELRLLTALGSQHARDVRLVSDTAGHA